MFRGLSQREIRGTHADTDGIPVWTDHLHPRNDVERARPKAVVARSTDVDRLVPSATAYLKADRGKKLELTNADVARAIGHG
jgi:hypothetical protein